jgi:hypothetical protein
VAVKKPFAKVIARPRTLIVETVVNVVILKGFVEIQNKNVLKFQIGIIQLFCC